MAITHDQDDEGPGRVRRAHPGDLAAIARMLARTPAAQHVARLGEQELAELITRSETIVLELAPGRVVAAACLTVRDGNGQLEFVVCEPDAAGADDRIRCAAAALFARNTPRFGGVF